MPAVSGPAVNPLSDGATPASAVLVPSTDGKLRLAILPMDLDTGITGADGAVLAENLQGQFRNPAYALIERMQILSLIKEKHFEGTGLFDSNSAGTIGRLASADCLLVGRMRKLRVTFQISAEIVDLHAKIKEHGVVFFRNLDDTPRQLADLAEQLGGTGERRPATDYLGDAMRANDLAEFRDLVASTAVDLDALPDHRCPLYELIVSGKVGSDMAVALVDGGAKMGKVTDGKTLLYLAAQNGLPDVVRAMVKKGVPVDVPNPQTGQTPLCAAIFYRKPETVAALLDLGADLDHQDERGVTPRQLAAKVDSPRVTAAIAAHAAGPAK
ncbi:ankyrin repeat domain-containing protein [Sphingomonas sp.]|uniref:ankyrin repeat domain-containing protein n=1 Tax=Sphingomonas sp. TaxID=28214 RepID=UPI003B00D39A